MSLTSPSQHQQRPEQQEQRDAARAPGGAPARADVPAAADAADDARPPVLVAVPLRGVTSETFVRAHVENLPTTVHVLSGRPLRVDDAGRDLLYPRSPVGRAMSMLRERLGDDVPRRQERAVARHLARLGVRVVLAEYGHIAVEMMAACRRAGVPLVAHFHGYDAFRRDVLAAHERTYPALFREAAGVVAVSHHMGARLERLGCPAEKIAVVRCGVAARFRVNAAPAQAPPRFVAVGRFVDKKAPHLTLLAFGQVLARHPDARLTMVGDGPLRSACLSLSRALGLDHAVEFSGALPPEQVAERLRGARAFVQHSITPEDGDSEGTPVSVMEAMLAGLPVASTRHGGIAEVVEDGQNGLLVEETDVAGFAAAMGRLAADPPLAGQFGAAARAYAERELVQDVAIAKLWSVLRAAASRPRS